MSKANKIALGLISIYLAYLAIGWIWYLPSLVDKRVRGRITLGEPASDVAKTFGIYNAFDTKNGAYCSSEGPPDVTRIEFYDVGGIPLIPLLSELDTSTTFCFDSKDALIAMHTERWIDGP